MPISKCNIILFLVITLVSSCINREDIPTITIYDDSDITIEAERLPLPFSDGVWKNIDPSDFTIGLCDTCKTVKDVERYESQFNSTKIELSCEEYQCIFKYYCEQCFSRSHNYRYNDYSDHFFYHRYQKSTGYNYLLAYQFTELGEKKEELLEIKIKISLRAASAIKLSQNNLTDFYSKRSRVSLDTLKAFYSHLLDELYAFDYENQPSLPNYMLEKQDDNPTNFFPYWEFCQKFNWSTNSDDNWGKNYKSIKLIVRPTYYNYLYKCIHHEPDSDFLDKYSGGEYCFSHNDLAFLIEMKL